MLLIKGAYLLDGVNYLVPTLSDILVDGGVIAAIGAGVRPDKSCDTLDLGGVTLIPGLTDIHTHCSDGFASIGCMPDKIGRDTGATTVFDAGTAGADTFDYFYNNIICKSETKVYSWLNVASQGLTRLDELSDINNIEPDKIERVVKRYPDKIIGLKARASGSVVGGSGIAPIATAKKVATSLKLPLMVHIGNPPPDVQDVLNLMGEGDIITHCCHGKEGVSLFEGGGLLPEVVQAQGRGVLFDIGHGNASFSFKKAAEMFAARFRPDFISTDIHIRNIDGVVKSQINVINKMLHCGLTLNECICKTTSAVAKKFHLGKVGEIKDGFAADFTLIKETRGSFELEDSLGMIVNSDFMFEHQGVFIDGKYSKN